jgi:hypothetical protein
MHKIQMNRIKYIEYKCLKIQIKFSLLMHRIKCSLLMHRTQCIENNAYNTIKQKQCIL